MFSPFWFLLSLVQQEPLLDLISLCWRAKTTCFKTCFRQGTCKHRWGCSTGATIQVGHARNNPALQSHLARPLKAVSSFGELHTLSMCNQYCLSALTWGFRVYHVNELSLYYQLSWSVSPGQRQNSMCKRGRVNPRGSVFVMPFPLCLTEDISMTQHANKGIIRVYQACPSVLSATWTWMVHRSIVQQPALLAFYIL